MPIYDWLCDHGHSTPVFRKMAEHEIPPEECEECFSKVLHRDFGGTVVMNHALPDGTRRFDGIRAQREKDKEATAKRRQETIGLIKKNQEQTCS